MNAPPVRWGPWASVAWMVAIVALLEVVDLVFLGVYIGTTMGHASPGVAERKALEVVASGDFLSAATLIANPICLLALLGIVKFKRGATYADTFALSTPATDVLVRWIVAVAIFGFASDALTWMLGKPIVPEFMDNAWRTSSDRLTLSFTMVACAPVFEEALFRGFLLSGLRPTRLGASGAVLLSSAAWAAIHLQYDFYGMSTIFVLGLLLGWARVRTGSIAVPLAMHITTNAIALVETIYVTSGGSP